MTQTDILLAIVEQLPTTPAKRAKRSLGPRPPWTRFWEKVDRTGDCWLWMASVYANGYGQFTVLGKPIKAHRWAYQNLVGRIPNGLQLDHLCRNRSCVNPDHLEPVTARVNALRGEGHGGVNARKTHCDSGHPFDFGNTHLTRQGHRACRRCHAIADAKRKARLRSGPGDNRPPT